MSSRETILEVKDLDITFHTFEGDVNAVNGVNYTLKQGETLAIVGESGSGKSVSSKAINGLLPTENITKTGQIMFEGKNLLELPENEMEEIRGKDIAMIFQNPMTSLNPTMSVGKQIAEPMIKHLGMSKEEAKANAIELMEAVGINDAAEKYNHYSHQFSGGMRQRVMIAIALACRPKILIADEPTTALDVTTQAQILELIEDLKEKFDTSVIFITHDLGVVAQMADRIAVMYAGEIVEIGTADEIFYDPKHPYTWGLLSSIPSIDQSQTKLYSIPGSPPNLLIRTEGEAFAVRNEYALKIDYEEKAPMFRVSETHYAKTWLLDPIAPHVEPPLSVRMRKRKYEEHLKQSGVKDDE